MLSSCGHAFHRIPVIQANGFQQATFVLLLIQQRALGAQLSNLSKPRDGKSECVREKYRYLFLAPPVIEWHHPRGAVVSVLLSEQGGELTECFCLPDRGWVTPSPLSPAEESSADEKLTLFNQIFSLYFPSFFWDISLPSLCM